MKKGIFFSWFGQKEINSVVLTNLAVVIIRIITIYKENTTPKSVRHERLSVILKYEDIKIPVVQHKGIKSSDTRAELFVFY